ncbi:MAG: hypothetical protein Q8904_16410, partial [Bacteroidota bacterium]|nr:hypothetical protein [Bacteroidota bacterium]
CNSEGLEIAMVFNINSSYIYRLYTNNIPQQKGTHHTGFKIVKNNCRIAVLQSFKNISIITNILVAKRIL